MRPVSAAASRTGSVTSMVSEASRASSAADFSTSRRTDNAWVTLSLARLMAAPCVLRSSGDILPSVASSAEIEPFLPSAATRTASSAASSPAAAICSRMDFSSVARSDTVSSPLPWVAARGGSQSASRSRPYAGRKPPGITCKEIHSPRAAGRERQAASAALAFSAIAWNATGSWMARSDSTLRSTVMPDFDRPSINRL